MNKEKLIEAVKSSKSKSDVCRKMGYVTGGGGRRKITKMIEDLSLDVSHFDGGLSKRNIKYDIIQKECPICLGKFETRLGGLKEKVTCSHSCANTYYRSGVNHPNWKDDAYRSTCFYYHKKKCVICEEDKIIDVHHYDEDRKNNSPDNLIPLCPTHHMYMHSRYKNLISERVNKYRDSFIAKQN